MTLFALALLVVQIDVTRNIDVHLLSLQIRQEGFTSNSEFEWRR